MASRVLIVEDEPALLRALQINLRARGYEVTTATAGQDALSEATAGARRGAARPGAARHGRHRRDPRAARLVRCPGDRPVRPGWFRGQDRRAGRRRRRLRDQAIRHRGTAGPAACRAAPGERRPAGDQLPHGPVARSTSPRTRCRAGSTAPAPAEREPVRGSPRPSGGCWRSCCGTQAAGRPAAAAHRAYGGLAFERSTHYLRFHMAGLRRKLEDDPHRPRHLLTEPGMGYRYQPGRAGAIDRRLGLHGGNARRARWTC